MEKTEKLTLRECIFGDKNFYRHVLAVVLPIIVQNTLTNVVSLLDNVMVGQVGTLPMSGVAIVGQLIFVYNLAIWGSTSGAGLFGAQYFGSGDMVCAADSANLQHRGIHPAVVHRIDPRGGAVYAAVRLCQLRLFYAAQWRKNLYYLPV